MFSKISRVGCREAMTPNSLVHLPQLPPWSPGSTNNSPQPQSPFPRPPKLPTTSHSDLALGMCAFMQLAIDHGEMHRTRVTCDAQRFFVGGPHSSMACRLVPIEHLSLAIDQLQPSALQ